jgi:hypothetical protein
LTREVRYITLHSREVFAVELRRRDDDGSRRRALGLAIKGLAMRRIEAVATRAAEPL